MRACLAGVLQVKVPAARMPDSVAKERSEDVIKRIRVAGGVAARSTHQFEAAAQILWTQQSDPGSRVQHCMVSLHHPLGFASEDRTGRVMSWAPADNVCYNEDHTVSDEDPACNSLANYRGANRRLRLTGKASMAAARMATDSQTLGYGIHSIDAAACSEDNVVHRDTKGIFVAPAVEMYDACSTMNFEIVFSGTYDIVYVEGVVTRRVSMAWLHSNGYVVVPMEESFYQSYDTSSAECQFDYGTDKCKNGVHLVMAPQRHNDFLMFSTCSVGTSLAGPASFHPMLSAITNAGLICLERKLRGRSGFDIYGRDNLYLMMMRGNGNVAYGMLRDLLDLRCD